MFKNVKKIGTSDIKMLRSSIENIGENYKMLAEALLTFFNPIQDGLNKKLCKNDSYAKELVTDAGKTINFGNCIISEANELLDCAPWRHWKDIDAEINYSNLELEMVDKFHFIPSILLCLWDIYPDTQKDTVAFLDKVRSICLAFIDREIIHYQEQEQGLNKPVIESIAGYGAFYGALTAQLFRLKLYSKESEILHYGCTGLEALAKENTATGIAILHLLVSIHSMLFETTYKLSLERIKNLYVVKNCLNILRAKNGYKEGFYIKDWFGKEDNEVALEIAAETEGLGINILMEKLNETYAEVVAAHKKKN